MIKVIFLALLFSGLFFIALDVFKVPYIKSSKSVRSVSQKQNKKISALDLYLGSISERLAKHIHINEFKWEELYENLHAAEINLTPEQFRANAIVKSVFTGIFAIPFIFIFPLLVPVILIGSILIYRSEGKRITAKLALRREKIEAALPGFVSTVEKTLKHSRDVLYMIESFAMQAEDPLKQELLITAADMRSGNQETAITRLESRVVSPQMSDVCRGLIGIIRGDETSVYWASLGLKFSDENRQRLKRRAQKVPKKVRWLSVALLVCFMLIYVVVIISQIAGSVTVLFS